jgi:hypothetical protein
MIDVTPLPGLNWSVTTEKASDRWTDTVSQYSASGSSVSSSRCYDKSILFAKTVERKYLEIEDLGTEAPYRCISCRGCADCKKGDKLELVSFKDEREQVLIEKSVEYDPVAKKLTAALPFTCDPVKELAPNRYIAAKILEGQMRQLVKNPEARAQVLESHEKLSKKGYSCYLEELTPWR